MKQFYTDWDEFKDAQLCNSFVATAIVGAGALAAGATIFSSSKASKAQTDASNTAANTQLGMYNQTRSDLASYRDMGARAGTELESRLPFLTSSIDVTKELQDPNSTAAKAYNFTRTQGLKAVGNSAAARGLGSSGAALKGAASFATGLADNTYTNLFNLENTNRTNAYNRLKGLVDTGAAAGGATGALGEKAAYGAGQAQIGAGNAQAAGYNAAGGAISNFSNNVGGYAAYRGLYGGTPTNPSNNGIPDAFSGFPGGSLTA